MQTHYRPVLLLAVAVLSAFSATPIIASAQTIDTPTPVAVGGTIFQTPLDAVPDPTGMTVYFTASTAAGESGVFAVAVTGGDVRPVLVGAPLVAARGLVVSSDGRTLFVADPAGPGGGVVYALPSGSGPATVLDQARGTAPQALDLVSVGGTDRLYSAGADPGSGQGMVSVVDLATGAAAIVRIGAELAGADGTAVSTSGDIFLALPGTNGREDTVVRLHEGAVEPVLSGVRLGAPAGLALTLDEQALWVSALADDGTSEVVVVDLASGATHSFNDVIGANHRSGGLHRALAGPSFAWANATNDGGVYQVPVRPASGGR